MSNDSYKRWSFTCKAKSWKCRLEGKELWRSSVPTSHSNGSWPSPDQLWLWLALNFLSVMDLPGEKSCNTSNWLKYTVLPIAWQLKAKQCFLGRRSCKRHWQRRSLLCTLLLSSVPCNTGFQSLESVVRRVCPLWPRKKEDLYLGLLSSVALVWALMRKEWKINVCFR